MMPWHTNDFHISLLLWDIHSFIEILNMAQKYITPMFAIWNFKYRQVSNIRRTLESNQIVDHWELHLHSPLNTWFQYIAQRQLQTKTMNI